MKRVKYSFSTLIVLIIAAVFGSNYFLDVDILSMVLGDTKAPIIDTSTIATKVRLDDPFTFDTLTCSDNVDTSCIVDVIGTVDTTITGTYNVILKATDAAGNLARVELSIEVYEGLNTAIYVPDGYYDSIDGMSGETLKAALNDIITGHTEYPYTSTSTDVWDMLRDADEDPDNPENVLLFYTGYSLPKSCQDSSNPPAECEVEIYGELKTVEWNREHIWSKSRGDFEIKEGTATVLDMGAHTDGHHLVAAERVMNSTKNNRHFEDCHDGDDTNIVDRGYGNYTCNDWEFEPRDEVKGDTARMIFYMAVRYEGEEGDMVDLEVINDPDSSKELKLPEYGDLDDLLRWMIEDPVSEKEIERNEAIFQFQGNRNPFIDHPELVELIWGSPEDYN
ncbi:hypothetical protein CI105_07275 [Candidatus Izimaplasma bacterium ZiA1]|uniref:endonuclease I family protein n=1 Tax=Candidatus Izimoplasma sp. ZiA1 TaxID=2024899 RepID=UPI000BAA4B5D|nr:hypothetical protein CI105_07275 [Candidatus Izimaplasma bacterium ZiA1]